ncbi:MAG: hypothetical protein U5K73_08965 [Halofilum sp. (in: g-proteobacteria)]|nr:hypothetical protein [Halofilum sp. (in: g-proteobacteria)]
MRRIASSASLAAYRPVPPDTDPEAEVSSLNPRLLIRQVPHARTRNQLLPLEHAAQQEADDHQDHGDLDQGETFLLSLELHFDSPPGGWRSGPPLSHGIPFAASDALSVREIVDLPTQRRRFDVR